MQFSLITYNILFNKAYGEVKNLFYKEKADIICLQEVDTNYNNLKQFTNSSFALADYTNSFVKFGKIYGVATFYNPKKFKLVKSSFIDLPQSFLEIFLIILRGINKPRTVLKTDFIYLPLNEKITVYNVHLTPFATNGIRIKQLKETLNDIKKKSNDKVIITGDFNYFYARKRFEKLIHNYDLKEATNKIFFTIEKLILHIFNYRTKLDYILYKNITNLSTKKIQIRHSDHFPIQATFKF